MSLMINTNAMSLNAQRNLSASSSDLAQALQRLSSGLRINSAKDDAAGLAIAARMTTQISGLNTGGAQCQRRHLAGADRGRRPAGGDQQPAAHP